MTITDPHGFLLKFLELVGYTDDKEIYIQKLLKVCHDSACAELLETLPKNIIKGLIEQLAKQPKNGEFEKLVNEFFPQDHYKNALQKATEEQFKAITETIIPSLSSAQLSDLQSFLTSSV